MDTSKFATKSDIKELKKDNKSIRGEILRVEEKVENVQDEIKDVRNEIKEFKAEVRSDSKTQHDKLDKIQNTLDGFVGRVDDLSIDNEVGTHHTRELELKVAALEKRVKRIESSKQAS